MDFSRLSSEADEVNRLIAQTIQKLQALGIRSMIILFVHDHLLIDVGTAEDAERVRQLLKDINGTDTHRIPEETS